MSYKEIRKIQKLLKTLRELNKLKQMLKKLKRGMQADEIGSWVKEHQADFAQLSDQDLQMLREKADYDEDAWQEIVRALRR